MTDRIAIEAALRARFMEQEGSPKALVDWNNSQTDWWGVCRKCGATIAGTPAQIKGHSCG